LIASISIGTLTQVLKQKFGLSADNHQSGSSIILTKENAEKIVDTLCKTRGAALKIGQMLSLQDNSIIDREVAEIFQRVRQSADFMPFRQVEKVLNKEFGKSWAKLIKAIDHKPFAAASIGQVHRAVLLDGSEAAMKIQYPGVEESIDSDIKNLLTILKFWNIVPSGLFIDNIVKAGKIELSWEVDYIREAEYTQKFAQLLKPYQDNERLHVPKLIKELSTKKIITLEIVNGNRITS
jgi:hypothetical protein